MTNSNDIKANAVARAVALLNAAGAQFKVIYGTVEYGELQVAPPAPTKPPKRNNANYPHGERTSYIKAFVANMQVGDVVSVPFGPYPAADIAHMVPPACQDLWGKSAAQTQTTATGVDVLRVL